MWVWVKIKRHQGPQVLVDVSICQGTNFGVTPFLTHTHVDPRKRERERNKKNGLINVYSSRILQLGPSASVTGREPTRRLATGIGNPRGRPVIAFSNSGETPIQCT